MIFDYRYKRDTNSIFHIFDLCQYISFAGSKILNMDPIGTDGTKYGYSPNFGGLSQPEGSSSVLYDCNTEYDCSILMQCYTSIQKVHELTWTLSGDFIISLGDNGDEKKNDSDEIYVNGYLATFDGALRYYTFTSLEFANILVGKTKYQFTIITI